MDKDEAREESRKRRIANRKTVVVTVITIVLAAAFIIGFMFLRGAQEVDRVLTLL